MPLCHKACRQAICHQLFFIGRLFYELLLQLKLQLQLE
uniref:Uncharacterized protein n=1 Tax=Rhizophora mucronata TaxID=61149 RepID=A0A2P2IVV7_RHIMU